MDNPGEDDMDNVDTLRSQLELARSERDDAENLAGYLANQLGSVQRGLSERVQLLDRQSLGHQKNADRYVRQQRLGEAAMELQAASRCNELARTLREALDALR